MDNSINNEINIIIEEIANLNPSKIVLSQSSSGKYKKIVIKAILLKDEVCYQIERFTETQAFHENIPQNELALKLIEEFGINFSQINVFSNTKDIDVKITKKKKLLINRRNTNNQIPVGDKEPKAHNRKKKYLLEEGEVILPLVDIGIFSKEGKIINSKYDKYKQINRFIEMVDDVLSEYKKDHINIIDFGCGKSYLTFVLYHYLVNIRGISANIVGLDLKEDVIKKCNETASKYNYDNLKFELGDINGYKALFDVDMVITLHACDTATDYALYNAVMWNARYILSVPCCQHEVNKNIKSDLLSPIMKYGILKERTSALITDGIRGSLLESKGYKVQMLEFIDIMHSPKNILIRAVKTNVSKEKRQKSLNEVNEMCKELNIKSTLLDLLG